MSRGLLGAGAPFLLAAALVAAAVQLDRNRLSPRFAPKHESTYISTPCELALTGVELFKEDEQLDRFYQRRDQGQRTCLVRMSSEAIEVTVMHPLMAQLIVAEDEVRMHYDELRLALPLESIRSRGESWGLVRGATVTAFHFGGCFGTGYYVPIGKEVRVVQGQRVAFDGPVASGTFALSFERSPEWRAISE